MFHDYCPNISETNHLHIVAAVPVAAVVVVVVVAAPIATVVAVVVAAAAVIAVAVRSASDPEHTNILNAHRIKANWESIL